MPPRAISPLPHFARILGLTSWLTCCATVDVGPASSDVRMQHFMMAATVPAMIPSAQPGLAPLHIPVTSVGCARAAERPMLSGICRFVASAEAIEEARRKGFKVGKITIDHDTYVEVLTQALQASTSPVHSPTERFALPIGQSDILEELRPFMHAVAFQAKRVDKDGHVQQGQQSSATREVNVYDECYVTEQIPIAIESFSYQRAAKVDRILYCITRADPRTGFLAAFANLGYMTAHLSGANDVFRGRSNDESPSQVGPNDEPRDEPIPLDGGSDDYDGTVAWYDKASQSHAPILRFLDVRVDVDTGKVTPRTPRGVLDAQYKDELAQLKSIQSGLIFRNVRPPRAPSYAATAKVPVPVDFLCRSATLCSASLE